MDNKMLALLMAELIESQGVALGLLTCAIASQLDAGKLAQDLDTLARNASKQDLPGGTEKIVAHMLKAAQEAARRQEMH